MCSLVAIGCFHRLLQEFKSPMAVIDTKVRGSACIVSAYGVLTYWLLVSNLTSMSLLSVFPLLDTTRFTTSCVYQSLYLSLSIRRMPFLID